jgi:glycosyltransferase involved in cell wall biosynthesis
MDSLAVVILTRDEERNIAKCLESLASLDAAVYVVDSASVDRTREIASSLGATVLQRPWTNYADQFNWALDNAGIHAAWTMRLDADEEVTSELARELRAFIDRPPAGVSGIYVRRRVYFLGKWIRHGGYYPTWLLRVWRTGRGRCEDLFMDEHMVVDTGRTVHLYADIIDRNNKDLSFWIDKHNRYASREVKDVLRKEAEGGRARAGIVSASLRGEQESSKRWIKDNVYLRLPLFVRPTLYFLYRYFLRLGFLDGKRGLVFHVLQAFWYRFLVDAKLYEHRLTRVRDGSETSVESGPTHAGTDGPR